MALHVRVGQFPDTLILVRVRGYSGYSNSRHVVTCCVWPTDAHTHSNNTNPLSLRSPEIKHCEDTKGDNGPGDERGVVAVAAALAPHCYLTPSTLMCLAQRKRRSS